METVSRTVRPAPIYIFINHHARPTSSKDTLILRIDRTSIDRTHARWGKNVSCLTRWVPPSGHREELQWSVFVLSSPGVGQLLRPPRFFLILFLFLFLPHIHEKVSGCCSGSRVSAVLCVVILGSGDRGLRFLLFRRARSATARGILATPSGPWKRTTMLADAPSILGKIFVIGVFFHHHHSHSGPLLHAST